MEIILDIIDSTVEGQGIGKSEGRVYFIEGAVPGDRVRVKNVQEKKRILYGETAELLNENPDRTEPFCPYFEECDGCTLQSLKYQAQLDLKRNSVLNAVNRIGGESISDIEIIGMEEPAHYRNKIELKIEKGRIGYYSRKSHKLVDIESCPVALPVIDENIALLQSVFDEVYEIPLKEGIIRNITLRSNGEDLQITVTTMTQDFPKRKELFKAMEKIEALAEIYHSVNKNPRKPGIRNPKLVFQRKEFTESIGSLKFRLSPESFFQVNHYNTIKLYEEARSQMELQGDEKILDLYCGIGTTSLYYAEKASHVTGVEIVSKAIENAKENARLNNINNTDFICGKSEEVIEKLLKEKEFDIIALDPPRKGLDEKVVEVIGKSSIKKVQYISCNPSTMARDIKRLKEYGFELKKIKACDMFSQTMHVECVVLMSRVKE